MATDTREQLEHLDNSLEEFEPTDHVSSELAAMFATLLAEAKKEHGDDPVVAAITPPENDVLGKPTMNAGTMRAAIAQLIGVYPKQGLLGGL